MHPLLTLLLQIVTLPILSCWFGFSLWALLFGMTLTGGLGLIIMPLFLQPWLPENLALRWDRGTGYPTLMWQIGWKEYRTQRIEFGCTAHQVSPYTDIPSWCPASFHSPIDDWEPKTLYKPSERVATMDTPSWRNLVCIFHRIKTTIQSVARLHTALPTLPAAESFAAKTIAATPVSRSRKWNHSFAIL